MYGSAFHRAAILAGVILWAATAAAQITVIQSSPDRQPILISVADDVPAEGLSWAVRPACRILIVGPRQIVVAPPPGEYRVTAASGAALPGAAGREDLLLAIAAGDVRVLPPSRFLVTPAEGPVPDPTPPVPVPTPGPTPNPQPNPPPTPAPTGPLQAVLVYEQAELAKWSPAQIPIFQGEKIREWFSAQKLTGKDGRPNWRTADKDQQFSPARTPEETAEQQLLRGAIQAATGKTLPVLATRAGGEWTVQPLPADVTATIASLKKAGRL